jgi:hypothetical protein
LDAKLVQIVNEAVKGTAPIGEKQIVELKRKLALVVEEHRKMHKPSTCLSQSGVLSFFKDDDLQSNKSRVHSQSNSTRLRVKAEESDDIP